MSLYIRRTSLIYFMAYFLIMDSDVKYFYMLFYVENHLYKSLYIVLSDKTEA